MVVKRWTSWRWQGYNVSRTILSATQILNKQPDLITQVWVEAKSPILISLMLVVSAKSLSFTLYYQSLSALSVSWSAVSCLHATIFWLTGILATHWLLCIIFAPIKKWALWGGFLNPVSKFIQFGETYLPNEQLQYRTPVNLEVVLSSANLKGPRILIWWVKWSLNIILLM